MCVLSVKNLHKSYGSVEAVKNVSFTVEAGEIFGILGPNGAGKSSTLECILGTRSKDSGMVRLLGMDPRKERQKVYQRVGVQFQDSSWQTGIRVGEICEATACLYNPEPDWRPLLKHFDLEKRKNSPVESCSGGEQQKLSILLACIHSPELVVLDELTTGLDPLARRETWELIRRMQDQGTSVVLTSHFMDEVEFLCGRGIILKEGVISAEGTIEELTALGRGKNLDDSYINLVKGV